MCLGVNRAEFIEPPLLYLTMSSKYNIWTIVQKSVTPVVPTPVDDNQVLPKATSVTVSIGIKFKILRSTRTVSKIIMPKLTVPTVTLKYYTGGQKPLNNTDTEHWLVFFLHQNKPQQRRVFHTQKK